MKKFASFLLGAVAGCAAGFLAGSLLVSDEQVDDVKNKIKDNDKLQDLKKKYDNGTEIVKNQLASFPKNVEDDSELKDRSEEHTSELQSRFDLVCRLLLEKKKKKKKG